MDPRGACDGLKSLFWLKISDLAEKKAPRASGEPALGRDRPGKGSNPAESGSMPLRRTPRGRRSTAPPLETARFAAASPSGHGQAGFAAILTGSETCVAWRIRVFTAGTPLYGCRYRLPANRVWSWTPLRAEVERLTTPMSSRILARSRRGYRTRRRFNNLEAILHGMPLQRRTATTPDADPADPARTSATATQVSDPR